jgi:hypothetical protein
MATGRHWEWRGFGNLSDELRALIEALPLAYPQSSGAQWFRDRYLWIPGSSINVKVREGGESGLKFKRLLAKDEDLELWEEKPEEIYSLPLDAAVLKMLAHELGLRFASIPEQPVSSEESLFSLLEGSTPTVAVILVEKLRCSYKYTPPGASSSVVFVEIAEIRSPKETTSVALESTMQLKENDPREKVTAAKETVARVREELGLPDTLKCLNYLEALEAVRRSRSKRVRSFWRQSHRRGRKSDTSKRKSIPARGPNRPTVPARN